MKDNKLEWDWLGIAGIVITFISILVSINLSPQYFIIAVGIFLIIISTYIFNTIKNTINKNSEEINKLNEKINIWKDISELKAKVDFLMMNKRGRGDFADILIRMIQIVGILAAFYLIFKAITST